MCPGGAQRFFLGIKLNYSEVISTVPSFFFFFNLEVIFSWINSPVCLTMQLYRCLCQSAERVWRGSKRPGAEEDGAVLCSCTGFVFLAVFVTVKTSCSFNCHSHDTYFCVKYWWNIFALMVLSILEKVLLITSKFLQIVGNRWMSATQKWLIDIVISNLAGCVIPESRC